MTFRLFSASLVLAPAVLHAALIDGLVAKYNFDETSGIVAADSVRGASGNGTLNSFPGTQWVAGKIGGSVQLDGADDWITTVDAIANGASAMSFSGWVWANARPTWATIAKNWGASAAGQFHFGLNAGDGRLSNYLTGGTNVIDPVQFPTGSWQHVAFTYDGITHRLYRNGAQVATGTVTTTLIRSSATVAFGVKTGNDGTAADTGSPGYWNGKYDDFAFWNRALSAAEVTEIYNNGQAGIGVGGSLAPVISGQPCSVTQSIGGRAEIFVSAGGSAPLSYQWRKNGTENVGTNSPVLVIDPVTAGDAASYHVVVTNGEGTATSTAAALIPVTALAPGGTGILQSLAGYWRFDETQGCTAADTSGQHNAGRLVNFAASSNAHWTAGKVGGALRFDGPASLNHVIVNNFPKATNAYSLAAWVWADTIPTWASIAKNWLGEFHFGLDATGNSLSNYVGLSPSGQVFARETATFPTGSWQHVVCTVDATSIRLYRNGTQVASSTYSGAWLSPPPAPMGIGVKLTGAVADTSAPGYWDGIIDDLALWNRTLSAAEVFNLYSAGAGGQDITNALPPPQPTTLVINEYLADNAGGLEDEDRDSPDWIELFNGTSAPVNLEGYHLSDNPANLTKWTFPAVTLGAGQYLVVFASNKDRRVPGQNLHTNFLISSEGEDLFLVAPDGTTVVHRYGAPLSYNSTPWYPAETNVSFGLSGTGDTSSYFPTPTPGQPNVAPVPAAGALISGVMHSPVVVGPGTPIAVTAIVQADQPAAGDGNTVASVNLSYRVMYGTESTLPMNDSGTGGDATAGDGIWSTTIPAGATAGQMVRWAVTATTTHGEVSRSPRSLLPNSPQYYGTVIHDTAITSPLPVIHRFVQDTAAADTIGGTRGSVFFDGEFYDNIFVRIRGNTSRNWPKKSHKIDFNPGYKFRRSPDLPRVSEINLNTPYTDKSYLRAILHTKMHQISGIVSPDIFPIHQRQNGAFYGVWLYTENVDDDFLQRHGIDEKGSLYKAVGDAGACNFTNAAAYEKKSRQDEGYADLQAVVTAMNLTGAAREQWLFDNIDMPSFVNWWAGVVLTQNIDASDKNYYVYRDTNGSREWQVIPWDLDLSFGPNALNTDTIVYNQNTPAVPACASSPYIGARPFLLHTNKYNRLLEQLAAVPRFRAMHTRRIRSLSDQFHTSGWFAAQIDAAIPVLQADVDADHARWGSSSHFNWGAGITLTAANNRIKNEYLAPRLGYLLTTNGGAETLNWTTGAGSAGIPISQAAAPVINFGTLETNPASGNQDEEFIQFTNPGTDAVDLSGWTLEGGVTFTFKGGTVIPAGDSLYLAADRHAFRQRTAGPRGGQGLLVASDYSGHLSNFSETLTLKNAAGAVIATTTTPDNPSDAQRWLRITEVFYNPPSSNDLEEFIEVTNTSPSATLTLTGMRFSQGITGADPVTGAPVYFSFPAMTLPPGSSTLVVRDQAAFLAAFPAVPPSQIAGTFPAGTALDNGGETLKLDDVDGSTIDLVTWNDVAPWPVSADGGGPSLHFVVNSALQPAGGDAARWFAFGPSPGSISADTDRDGLSDLAEFRAGTDPGDGGSFLIAVITVTGGAVHGTFPGVAGKRYRVRSSPDLVNWTNVGSDITPVVDGEQSFTDTPSTGRIYYRIELP
jgi:hypothetical protein